MDSAGFDVSRWDHWLLIISFVGVASCGLRLAWQWRSAHTRRQTRRQKSVALPERNASPRSGDPAQTSGVWYNLKREQDDLLPQAIGNKSKEEPPRPAHGANRLDFREATTAEGEGEERKQAFFLSGRQKDEGRQETWDMYANQKRVVDVRHRIRGLFRSTDLPTPLVALSGVSRPTQFPKFPGNFWSRGVNNSTFNVKSRRASQSWRRDWTVTNYLCIWKQMKSFERTRKIVGKKNAAVTWPKYKRPPSIQSLLRFKPTCVTITGHFTPPRERGWGIHLQPPSVGVEKTNLNWR